MNEMKRKWVNFLFFFFAKYELDLGENFENLFYYGENIIASGENIFNEFFNKFKNVVIKL